ncbi:leucyl/phenylalanyl-tRNA--protein transferase [Desulfonatronum thiosulfatophilum]|uniref:Leucyl/phenylalanyl-tRNA--protein transferase n=1 Tax=Desulfonatronum thiosulfatophilum TaxID=617002 RepID=A0A1G5ZZW1_9BACT|nr:leucyl/phenylalanyl-tRNA--protein transferase [Desulfonatronum thiosulfatophilum]
MPVYALNHRIVFPPVENAEPDGLLAVGGDLTPERLFHAYSLGIFPWYAPGSPILWWSPDPRLVLFPEELHISSSLRKFLRRNAFQVSFDKAFKYVITRCATVPRPNGPGTWLVPEMRCAYIKLHEVGVAHSVEVWEGGELVGGIYGVALGRIFFGESMFHTRANASKVALIHLVQRLRRWDFQVLDCQQTTQHMLRFGAREIPRTQFMTILEETATLPTIFGKWADD